MKLALLTLAALALLAPAAEGATVGRDTGQPYSNELWFRAAPGEANDLTIFVAEDGIHFRDAGAPVTPTGSPCEAVSPHEVVCFGAPSTFSYRRAELGDGDDRVSTDGVQARLGPGDDVATSTGEALFGDEGNDDISGPYLEGGPGDDLLRGTPGPDTLSAGPGRDEVRAGDGDDRITDGGAPGETDTFDGGPGSDHLDYGFRSDPLLIDLPRDVGGGQGEDDRLPGIEGGATGAGADLLVGDDGDNSLYAGGGDDVLRGGAGADTLSGAFGNDQVEGGDGADSVSGDTGGDVVVGGAGDDAVYGGGYSDIVLGSEGNDRVSGGVGADSVDAGPGDDLVEMEWDRFVDRLRCGDGTDRAEADTADVAEPDCEAVTRRTFPPFLRGLYGDRRTPSVLEPSGRSLIVSVLCPDHCLGRFVLRVAGRVAVDTTWRCPDDYDGACVGRDPPTVTATLPRWVVRRILRRGRVAGRVTMAFQPGGIPSRERVVLVRRRVRQ
ncbi:MAG TPA: calcium-binding protein [Solirubrobacteraceae bacterium]